MALKKWTSRFPVLDGIPRGNGQSGVPSQEPMPVSTTYESAAGRRPAAVGLGDEIEPVNADIAVDVEKKVHITVGVDEKELVEDSPYEAVRAAVRNTDGGEVANTVRAWILGMTFVTVASAINMFLSMRFGLPQLLLVLEPVTDQIRRYRSPAISITAVVIQLSVQFFTPSSPCLVCVDSSQAGIPHWRLLGKGRSHESIQHVWSPVDI